MNYTEALPLRAEAMRNASALLNNPDATGAELTRARIALADAFAGAEPMPEAYVRMRRDLAVARARADARDGLRCNGRPRKPRAVGFLRKGGPNNAA